MREDRDAFAPLVYAFRMQCPRCDPIEDHTEGLIGCQAAGIGDKLDSSADSNPALRRVSIELPAVLAEPVAQIVGADFQSWVKPLPTEPPIERPLIVRGDGVLPP